MSKISPGQESLNRHHPHANPGVSFHPDCPGCQAKIPARTQCRRYNCENLVAPGSRDCPDHQPEPAHGP